MRFFLFIIAAFFAAPLLSQHSPGKYWVQFADKTGSPFSISEPEDYLSAKSIARRSKIGFPINEQDLPVNPHYVQGVLALGNAHLHHTTKWMNAMTVEIIDTSQVQQWRSAVLQLPYVVEVRRVLANANGASRFGTKEIGDEDKKVSKSSGVMDTTKYGPSFRQISMINGHLLHQLGYEGQGMEIAVLDGGWFATNTLPAFDALYQEGRIKETRDFVTPNADSVYYKSTHGTFVLSHMAGIIPDSLYGTAPKANYHLFRTEDVDREYLIEEDNWLAAAEYCDSIGIDIINSSLGYSEFDDPTMNHTYEDMDGNTCVGSRAADMAAQRGILVVNSAGNSGNSPWHYITAPSDGDSVLCVGAVNSERFHAEFSGFGPSSDGDVKPNICTMGERTVFAATDSTIRTGNGTSFSSPIMAGAAACLWQAFPHKTNMEIFRAIEQSAHLYANPNDSLGCGIPDMWRAYQLLQSSQGSGIGELEVLAYPNPTSASIKVQWTGEKNDVSFYYVFDSSGKKILSGDQWCYLDDKKYNELSIDMSGWADGMYFLQLEMEETYQTVSLQKITPQTR